MQQEFQSSEVWSSLRNAAFDSALNEAAGNLQVLELATRAGLIDRSAGEEDDEAVVSVTYRLPTRTTLPSRSDRQLIQIASLPTKAEFYRVASPVLTSYVYEEAVLTNASEMLLLAGPASVFADGEFVGHGEVPTVAMGASFPIGFGIDSSLRASRELVNKSETTQGGNRIVSFNYRLSVENFATAPVDVRVFDRLPRSKGSDIKVTLVSGKAHLSDDHAYQSDGRNKGILRWDTQIPAEAIGPQAMTIDYEFQIEYDRQMAITGLAMAD